MLNWTQTRASSTRRMCNDCGDEAVADDLLEGSLRNMVVCEWVPHCPAHRAVLTTSEDTAPADAHAAD